ncbi:MAG: DUF3540 domain-containing protein [Gammaproteobacteria bacterium]|nr:DUF3540 domain-containing protein [Gammaproteobacteria bacterium]
MAEIIEFISKEHKDIALKQGEILSENAEGLYEVLMSDGPIWMKKCDACLLKPEVGDEVIVVVLKNTAAILSILNAKNKERILDLGQAAMIKADRLSFQSQNYTLTSHYATESIQYGKMLKSPLLMENVKTIQIQTDQFAVN